MRRLIVGLVIVAILLVVLVILGPFYILSEGEQAVVTRFGAIVDVTTEPGLKFKLPVVDDVVRYSAKILSWDGDPSRVPTGDGENQFIFVDTTARWRIADPRVFYQRLNTLNAAFNRLDGIIDSAVRNVISANSLSEAVRSTNGIIERAQTVDAFVVSEVDEISSDAINVETLLEQQVLATSNARLGNVEVGRQGLSELMLESAQGDILELGIELIDVVIRQVRYSDDLTQQVFARMISDRRQIAQLYRAAGEGRQREIRGELENDQRSILSRAFETSETIRGEADAEAAQIYSSAYTQDQEFFAFWRAIESYRQVLPRFSTTLSTDLEYFRYLYSPTGD